MTPYIRLRLADEVWYVDRKAGRYFHLPAGWEIRGDDVITPEGATLTYIPHSYDGPSILGHVFMKMSDEEAELAILYQIRELIQDAPGPDVDVMRRMVTSMLEDRADARNPN